MKRRRKKSEQAINNKKESEEMLRETFVGKIFKDFCYPFLMHPSYPFTLLCFHKKRREKHPF